MQGALSECDRVIGDALRYLFATLRALAAAAGVIAITATFLDTASRGPINPFNFFGFFTIQSNILAAVVLAITAVVGFSGRKQSSTLRLARGSVATYMIIVGLVYNTLLTGLAGGVSLPWANAVLHVWLPIYLAFDWVLFGDRDPLHWNRFWVVLVYPLVWLSVVLIRGATDGWVPYPFLDPATGYGSVALYSVAIAVGFGAFGALVWALSRVRILRPRDLAGPR